MENYYNTAKLEYSLNCKKHTVYSNTVTVSAVMCDGVISGMVDTGVFKRKWKLLIIQENGGWICHSLASDCNKEFSFDINTKESYILKFICKKGCCLNIDSFSQKYISKICFKQI